jgi:hypothetical protein
MMDFAKIMSETEESNFAVKAFTDAARAVYGSDAYAAGFLGSRLIVAMNELPKHKRAEIRNILFRHAEELESQLWQNKG